MSLGIVQAHRYCAYQRAHSCLLVKLVKIANTFHFFYLNIFWICRFRLENVDMQVSMKTLLLLLALAHCSLSQGMLPEISQYCTVSTAQSTLTSHPHTVLTRSGVFQPTFYLQSAPLWENLFFSNYPDRFLSSPIQISFMLISPLTFLHNRRKTDCICLLGFYVLITSIFFLYLTAQSPCDNNPCVGGGTCAVGLQDHIYHCICPPGKTGRDCEKRKQNSAKNITIIVKDCNLFWGASQRQC